MDSSCHHCRRGEVLSEFHKLQLERLETYVEEYLDRYKTLSSRKKTLLLQDETLWAEGSWQNMLTLLDKSEVEDDGHYLVHVENIRLGLLKAVEEAVIHRLR